MAIASLRAGEDDKAVQPARAGLAIHVDNTSLHRILAAAYAQTGLQDAAAQAGAAALRLDPDDSIQAFSKRNAFAVSGEANRHLTRLRMAGPADEVARLKNPRDIVIQLPQTPNFETDRAFII